MSRSLAPALLWATLGACAAAPDLPSFEERVTHGYLDSDGVQLHYASLGDGPLVVMLHGFPDYWYTWRHQMEALSEDHQVVALDLRGYNLSDQPAGVDAYAMRLLMADVAATIHHFDREQAIVVGHDWGGAIAWQFAMWYPQMVERLVILNLPYPAGFVRELSSNSEQHANSQYARNFQEEGAHEYLAPEGLASWVVDEDARALYVEAFERSSIEAMLNYYKANFPRTPAPGEAQAAPAAAPQMPIVQVPVLQFHGLEDRALIAAGLNGTWEWLASDWTLVTVPGAGHFVQQDAAELVTRSMVAWLHR